MRKYKGNHFLIFLVFTLMTIIYCSSYQFNFPESTEKDKYSEADYVKEYCDGQIEYRLPDQTRVDCLTEEYAIEFDWAKKWAESIGQSLYYSKMTGKKPATAIIIKSPSERKYIDRIKKVDGNITVFEIKSKDFKY